jgi:hypothetical protein
VFSQKHVSRGIFKKLNKILRDDLNYNQPLRYLDRGILFYI